MNACFNLLDQRKPNNSSNCSYLHYDGRPCDMSRVQEIVRQKRDTPAFPGVISVFEFPPQVPLSIAVPQVKSSFVILYSKPEQLIMKRVVIV